MCLRQFNIFDNATDYYFLISYSEGILELSYLSLISVLIIKLQ